MINIPREYHDHEDLGLNSAAVDAILVALDGSSVFKLTWRVLNLIGNDDMTDSTSYVSLISKGYTIYGTATFPTNNLIVDWPLDEAVVDDIQEFTFNAADVEDANHILGVGLTGGTVNSKGGIWGGIPLGVKEDDSYFEVNLTAKSDPSGKYVIITNVVFDASHNLSIFPLNFFDLVYSLNSDFSNSVVALLGGDISLNDVNNPVTFDLNIDNPIVLSKGKTVYFRLYPWRSDEFASFVMHKNTFKINGFVTS